MSRWLVLFGLVLLEGVSPVGRAATSLATATLNGHRYVDLAAWGRRESLKLKWDGRSRDVFLVNRGTRLHFTLDASGMEFNHVNLWLCEPVLAARRKLWISRLDMEQTLKPLVQPPRLGAHHHIRLIVLDPGHGGRDPGNIVGKHEEKTYTLLLAKRVRAILEEAHFKVILTRDRDETVSLEDRVALARRKHADLFISLHFNAAGNGDREAKGVEVYAVTPKGARSTNALHVKHASTSGSIGDRNDPENILLAYELQRALVRDLSLNDRGVRRARFQVLRDATMPAALVEGGFMTNPEEGRRIYSAAYRNRLAHAIVDGILAFKRLVER